MRVFLVVCRVVKRLVMRTLSGMIVVPYDRYGRGDDVDLQVLELAVALQCSSFPN